MRFAIINNGIVENIALAAGPQGANWIELTGSEPQPGIGWTYDGTFQTPPEIVPPAPLPDLAEWFIDIGPFFDRFGAAKMPVLMSTDATVKAILADIQVRKWIDLQRADVITALTYVGSVVPSVTAALQTTILTTPVTAEENKALKKLYF